MIKKAIFNSNRWYDNLPEPKRLLFFLVFIMGTFILTQYFSYTTQNFMIFPIWALIVSIWRGVYILSN